MVLTRRVARFNRLFANHVVGPVLTRMPGFAAVHHRGRRSGRCYRTPVKLFRQDGDYVIALPYGPSSDWVKNVLAAGGCELVTGRRRIRMVEPRLVPDDKRVAMPAFTRAAMRRLKSTEYLCLTPADRSSRPSRAANAKE